MKQIIQFYKEATPLDSSKHYFLICGKAFESGVFDTLFKNVSYYRISKVQSNPTDVYAKELVDIFKRENCNAIVAIGGGSAMDTAKAIKYYLNDQNLELIVAPTTAGTGSESTQFAVIYIDNKKHSLDEPWLLPNRVILNEDTLTDLPMYQKKATMLDAFGQCVESIWAKDANEESRGYACEGLKLFKNSYKAYLKGETSANKAMMEFANYSGKAINISRTTLPHALSYGLTIYGHVPHGYGVALTLPYAIKMLEESGSKEITVIKEALDVNTSLHEYYMNLLKEVELPEFDLHEVSLKDLLSSVNAGRLANYPIEVSEQQIEAIYKEVCSCK